MKVLPREGFSEGQWSLNGSNSAEWGICCNGFALPYVVRTPHGENSKSDLTNCMKKSKIRVFFTGRIPQGRPPISATSSCCGSWPDPVRISVAITRPAESSRFRIAEGSELCLAEDFGL